MTDRIQKRVSTYARNVLRRCKMSNIEINIKHETVLNDMMGNIIGGLLDKLSDPILNAEIGDELREIAKLHDELSEELR